ncbi:circularly permuted type 2 ATP-grasp protein [Thalassobaculum sp. OXR-137]|nr:circularly permuted type 2 ATP-grasp protein [Thalassobaculum sp. OXR-137]WPZ37057.1 circularly permuted type 2 ATP-grasp protein [Thalassobaculum sp. OXR-137]
MRARHRLLEDYDPDGFFCEYQGDAQRQQVLAGLLKRLNGTTPKELTRLSKAVDRELYNLGITFTLYHEGSSVDRVLPFDLIPRVLTPADWEIIESGSIQRVQTLNLLLADIYGEQKCIKDGILPADLVFKNPNYRPEMVGLKVPENCYVNVCGVDVVRGGDGQFVVLEDNARSPSGVSYVVENRQLMRRTMPNLFEGMNVRPVLDYGLRLHHALCEAAPAGVSDPQVVLLSPGPFNSAYFEHVFLAREMGIPLVTGQDMVVENDKVYMRTTGGLMPVHVIYRRINDDFLDPEVFREDSMLGVPGLMRAYAKGNITIANAVGTGVADDKGVYAYIPRLIKYYLDQDAILPNVPTNLCREKDGLQYTLDNLDKLVTKPVGEAGGYGVVIGPRASLRELEATRKAIEKDPANYISQPMVELSVSPTLISGRVEPRHVDLRPFCVTGKSTWVLPGGLTRVALKKGSLVVNSSQGGGSKDTWVLE